MHTENMPELVAAGAFVVLVLLLAYPLIKLGRTLDEATSAIRATNASVTPLLSQAQSVLNQAELALSSVRVQLPEVEVISQDVTAISSNVAALTLAVSSAVSRPIGKLATLPDGVRSSLQKRGARSSLRRALGRSEQG